LGSALPRITDHLGCRDNDTADATLSPPAATRCIGRAQDTDTLVLDIAANDDDGKL